MLMMISMFSAALILMSISLEKRPVCQSIPRKTNPVYQRWKESQSTNHFLSDGHATEPLCPKNELTSKIRKAREWVSVEIYLFVALKMIGQNLEPFAQTHQNGAFPDSQRDFVLNVLWIFLEEIVHLNEKDNTPSTVKLLAIWMDLSPISCQLLILNHHCALPSK